MKKTSILSSVILIVITLIIAFSIKATENPDKKVHVKMKITGCDCKNGISYCMDGGPVIHTDCVFDFYCEEGSHSMCLYCGNFNGGAGGAYNFVASGENMTLEVNLLTLTAACNCDGTKKK